MAIRKLNKVTDDSLQVHHKIEDPQGNQAAIKIGTLTITQSEARYRRLFETAKDGILILDGDTGRIIDANPFLQDMLGYPESELIGKALWEIGPVKNISASQESMRHLQSSEYIRFDDLPLETKGGEHKQVEFVSNVYLVNGWRVIQCNIRDVTARKVAEAHLRAAHDELLVLVTELRNRDRQMQLLNHMNDLLQSCVTQSEAYQVITQSGRELFPGQSGCLAIMPDRNLPLEVVAHWGTNEIIAFTFSMEDCWALRRGQLHEVVHPKTDLICHHFTQSPPGGYLCLPLTVQGEILGVLSLIDNSSRASQKSEHQLSLQQMIITFSETIKLSLSNMKLRAALHQQTIHDSLTNLFNRRYMEETLERELRRAARKHTPLGIIMLDIDDFKQYNETHGHAAGDAVLRKVGGLLLGHVRGEDMPSRYGGDEFIIILPEASLKVTSARAELLCEQARHFHIEIEGEVLNEVTLSMGVAVFPENGSTSAGLLKAVDDALYRAKHEGRGLVISAD